MFNQVVALLILDSEGERLAVKYSASSSINTINNGGYGSKGQITAASATSTTINGVSAKGIRSSINGGSSSSSKENDFELADFNHQRKFETQVMQKANRLTGRSEVEILMLGCYVVLVRPVNDISIFVVGLATENELILLDVINALAQTLATITNGQVGKRQILEQLDSVFIMLDELTEGGIILETDPNIIFSRIQMTDGGIGVSNGNGIGSGQAPQHHDNATAFNQALANAKDNIMRSFLSGTS